MLSELINQNTSWAEDMEILAGCTSDCRPSYRERYCPIYQERTKVQLPLACSVAYMAVVQMMMMLHLFHHSPPQVHLLILIVHSVKHLVSKVQPLFIRARHDSY